MRMGTILRFGAVVLPILLAGCADSLSGMRSVYGDETWSNDGLTATNYERGKHHFAQGRYGLAVKHFQMALARDPDSIEAMNALAASFDRLGRFDVAERLYLRALDHEPSSVQSLNNLGYSYLLQRRYELAMTYLLAAQIRDPANVMIAQNFQKVETALDLKARSFVAAPVQYGGPLASAQDRDSPDTDQPGQVVHLWAVGPRSDVWIERSKAAVQRLITNPQSSVFLAARDAGVAPALANYRTDTAAAARATQPTPWEVTGRSRVSAWLPAAPAPVSVSMPEVAILPDVAPTFEYEPSRQADRHADAVVVALKTDSAEFEAASFGAPISLLPTRDPTTFQVASLGAPISLLPQDYPADFRAAPREQDVVMGLEELLAIEQQAAEVEAAFRQADQSPALSFSDAEMPLVEVSNGTGRLSMALRMSGFLEAEGLDVVRLTNAGDYRHQETTVFYRDGWLETAETLAAVLPAGADLQADPDQRADIRIELGGDLLNFDRELFYARRKSSSEPSG